VKSNPERLAIPAHPRRLSPAAQPQRRGYATARRHVAQSCGFGRFRGVRGEPRDSQYTLETTV